MRVKAPQILSRLFFWIEIKMHHIVSGSDKYMINTKMKS